MTGCLVFMAPLNNPDQHHDNGNLSSSKIVYAVARRVAVGYNPTKKARRFVLASGESQRGDDCTPLTPHTRLSADAGILPSARPAVGFHPIAKNCLLF